MADRADVLERASAEKYSKLGGKGFDSVTNDLETLVNDSEDRQERRDPRILINLTKNTLKLLNVTLPEGSEDLHSEDFEESYMGSDSFFTSLSSTSTCLPMNSSEFLLRKIEEMQQELIVLRSKVNM